MAMRRSRRRLHGQVLDQHAAVDQADDQAGHLRRPGESGSEAIEKEQHRARRELQQRCRRDAELGRKRHPRHEGGSEQSIRGEDAGGGASVDAHGVQEKIQDARDQSGCEIDVRERQSAEETLGDEAKLREPGNVGDEMQHVRRERTSPSTAATTHRSWSGVQSWRPNRGASPDWKMILD